MQPFKFLLMSGLSLALLQSTVFAADQDSCRDGYSTMLLTQEECNTWVSSRKDMEKRGDLKALQSLDQQMQALMDDRASVCPCTWDRSLKGINPARSARY
jgi:photosystem II stability/assembly factor-like uncharacterized protein